MFFLPFENYEIHRECRFCRQTYIFPNRQAFLFCTFLHLPKIIFQTLHLRLSRERSLYWFQTGNSLSSSVRILVGSNRYTGASTNYKSPSEEFLLFLFYILFHVSPLTCWLNFFALYSNSSWLIVYSLQNSTSTLFWSLNTIIFREMFVFLVDL